MRCDAVRDGKQCTIRPALDEDMSGHGATHRDLDGEEWPVEEWIAPLRDSVVDPRRKLLDIAQATDPGRRAAMVGRDDPINSHIAAERMVPHQSRRKREVLAALQAACGGWVNGVDISTKTCGGSQGLKRLRELRAEGWLIESRPNPVSDTAWQYRLVGQEQAQPLRNFD